MKFVMCFFLRITDGRHGVAVKTPDGSRRGILAGETEFPGSLDDLVNIVGFGAAGAALEKGPPVDPDSVTYDLPFKSASKVLCVGLNYADHAAEADMDLPKHPTVFARFNENLLPNGAAMVRPAVSDQLDDE